MENNPNIMFIKNNMPFIYKDLKRWDEALRGLNVNIYDKEKDCTTFLESWNELLKNALMEY